jgi:hypothetical protein
VKGNTVKNNRRQVQEALDFFCRNKKDSEKKVYICGTMLE